jgi:serine/threonine-protein kinase
MAAMGRLVAGQYELITVIGRGPTGTVWRAEHRGTREAFAVKLLDAQFAGDPTVVDRFIREQHVLSAFLHPAVVRVRELITDEFDLALAGELIEGPDLRQEMRVAGPVGPETALGIATQCADALAAAHAVGVVHCDLKPANILLGPGGEVRLTDSRVARLARGHRDGVSRFGDPEYAAPEVILGGPPVTATDVYGLGLVLYETLLGTPLCYGDEPAQVLGQHLRGRPVVPMEVAPALRNVLEATLAVDPQSRPPAAEVAEHLHRLAAGRHRPATPAALPPAPRIAEPAPAPAPAPPPPPARDRPPSRPARTHGRTGHAPQNRWLRPLLIALACAMVGALAVVIITSLPAAQGSSGHGAASAPPRGGSTATGGRGVPSLDATATAPNATGAAAFVRYWFATLNYAVDTGKTGPLSAASSPACRGCASVVKAISKGYQNGARLRGGEYTVREATADNFFSMDTPRIGVVYDRSPYSVVGPSGDQLESSPGVTFANCQVLLEQVDGRWRTRELSATIPLA